MKQIMYMTAESLSATGGMTADNFSATAVNGYVNGDKNINHYEYTNGQWFYNPHGHADGKKYCFTLPRFNPANVGAGYKGMPAPAPYPNPAAAQNALNNAVGAGSPGAVAGVITALQILPTTAYHPSVVDAINAYQGDPSAQNAQALQNIFMSYPPDDNTYAQYTDDYVYPDGAAPESEYQQGQAEQDAYAAQQEAEYEQELDND